MPPCQNKRLNRALCDLVSYCSGESKGNQEGEWWAKVVGVKSGEEFMLE